MDSATTLASLAMLKVNIDNGKDYLEYLNPYVIHVLHKKTFDSVSDASVADGLREICGLEIPIRTVNIVLQRLSKLRYLVRENGVYKIAHLPETNFDADKAESIRHIESVSNELARFSLNIAGRELKDSEPTDAIVAFLSRFSIPCLRSFLRGTALPSFNADQDWQVVLVGQFVSSIQSHTALLESFIRFVQGHMLANALLCPDLQSVSSTYEGVSFYLDTPLLIRLLGLEGREEQQAVEEVIRLVSRLKGKVLYFSHTQDELLNAIKISSDYIDNPKGRGTIIDEARRSGRTKSDLVLTAESAADRLEQMGVLCSQTPTYDQKNHRFEISEQAFSEVLDDEISYNNPRARDYDIKSVRSIYVLRQGLAPATVEKSKAVLVTSNTSFSKAAFEYGKKFEQSREVSTVITDFSLANIAWLKAPQGAPNLPKKELVALAYAATLPSRDFWSKVLFEADKLQEGGFISARDHQLLRSSQHVQKELMRLTLGADEALNRESITKTLARVTEEIRAEDALALQGVSQRNAELAAILEGERARLNKVKERIYWSADKRAKWEARALSIVIWALQILVAAVGIVVLWWKIDAGFWAFLLIVSGIGSTVLRLAGAQWDIKPVKIKQNFWEWRRAQILKTEYEKLALTDEVELVIG